MSGIGAFPQGISSLLDLAQGGAALTREAAEFLQPTIELREQFLLNGRITTTFSGIAPVLGPNDLTDPLARVPSGELWYVWHYFARCTTAAGQAISLQASCNFNGSANVALGRPDAIAASSHIRAISSAPFWAPPGAVFGFICNSLTGAVATVDGGISYTSLRV